MTILFGVALGLQPFRLQVLSLTNRTLPTADTLHHLLVGTINRIGVLQEDLRQTMRGRAGGVSGYPDYAHAEARTS